jgi:hypothetical protein
MSNQEHIHLALIIFKHKISVSFKIPVKMPQHDTNATTSQLVSVYANIIKEKVILTTGVSLRGLGGIFL